MINKEQLLSAIDQSTNNLVTQLSLVKEEEFNKRPDENSWSPADVGEHLLS